ncbi:MAG: pilus assembly protein CpaF, partial [Bradyrhizobium sp.]|nr:pilus assembly protein CpaF [Bradyrhizobium sp.]
MFGKRSGTESDTRAKPAVVLEQPSSAAPVVSRNAAPPAVSSPPLSPARAAPPPPVVDARRSDTYYQVKATIFGALIEAIDLAQLAKLDGESAREEIRDIVNEIIAIKNIV